MEKIKPSVSNKVYDENGKEFKSIRQLAKYLNVNKEGIIKKFKKGENYKHNGHIYSLNNKRLDEEIIIPDIQESTNDTHLNNHYNEIEEIINSNEYKEFIESKNISELPFEKYEFNVNTQKGHSNYAIALFSDAHIEETVTSDSVLGLNEYNINIATERIKKYFVNLVDALNKDNVKNLIFAVLGDCISGYIHEELSQTNGCTPLEATFIAQNLIYNGLEYIVDNSTVENIKFIGIVGNHGRTTKKIQHTNGHVMSYEWLMYKNIEKQIELTGLPIEVEIPNSEMAILQTSDGKKYLFMHGFQIKTSGVSTVCGIYPALNRLSLKLDRNFHQDKIYIGHFHSCISIPNATVNGSIIGFSAYSLSNGFSYEEPSQMYELYDENGFLILTRKIYCR